jgi:hypothetical protein
LHANFAGLYRSHVSDVMRANAWRRSTAFVTAVRVLGWWEWCVTDVAT